MKIRIYLLASGIFLLFVGSGCQAMKKMLNNESPRKRPSMVQSHEQHDVFPGSRKGHGNRPSILDSELSAQERDAMKAQSQENRFPKRDYDRIRREDKAASDWVLGR